MAKSYTIIIRKEDNAYIGECLNLPVCAQSDNLDELRQFMIDGIKIYLQQCTHNEEDSSFVEQLVLEVSHG
ncbi:MAG: hypothetical protein FWC53_03345 [Firmicutes bacterium]|nr:hypothetical protein [Bacillota bacterium]